MPSQPRRKPYVRLAVVTDSSACSLLLTHEIIVVPLAFQFDGQQYLDGHLSPAAVLQASRGVSQATLHRGAGARRPPPPSTRLTKPAQRQFSASRCRRTTAAPNSAALSAAARAAIRVLRLVVGRGGWQ